jgi:hypothetical protein
VTKYNLGPCVQVGIVVRDVEATLKAWGDRFEIGEVRIIDWPVPGTNMETTGTYHGKPGNFRMRLAFIEAGPVQMILRLSRRGSMRRSCKAGDRRCALARSGRIWIRRMSWRRLSNCARRWLPSSGRLRTASSFTAKRAMN